MSDLKNTKELRGLDKEKLLKELSRAKNEGYQARMKHTQRELKETHTLGLWKRYIARIITHINLSK